MDKFTIIPHRWYASELIGEEFGSSIRSYSPIRVDQITPNDRRKFSLAFYHANYPEGVRDKVYDLKTLERNSFFILACSTTHEPARLMLIHAITTGWFRQHFGEALSETDDVQRWLTRNA